ncbi:Ig-like domain-containing protein [Candidatus Nitronereus thalassa]|uniref:Ig-like domain-containing protein n=1 Tax=Candidatus Nitronereus thalassa TaxID=3020898 RepID=A0ABU3K536_9BACT|nr:Ig-like domain-containing protein [Candidatus Nitronereus thalassa]MDT7041519.1 Ig-like domain-containing protein [Candidatus Nitronereus thalassa]
MGKQTRLQTKIIWMGLGLCVGVIWFLVLMPRLDLPTRADIQGNWAQAGFLDTARTYLATATLLGDGDVLLVGGQAGLDGSGHGVSNATTASELYMTSSDEFIPVASMSESRAGHTATLLQNERVLVAGGINNEWAYQSTAELYEPGVREFAITGSMMTPRAGHVAVQLSNGNVLIVGGHDGTNFLASAELYDPSTGVFTQTGSMHGARSNFSGVLLTTGKVLVLGGYGPPNKTILNSAEVYDPALGTFTPTGALHIGRAGFLQAVRLESGEVLVAGGVGSGGQALSSAELYFPGTGSFVHTGPMINKRQHHTLTRLQNGEVLVVGGWTGSEQSVLSSVEIFHPETGTFSEVEPMAIGRGHHTATLLNNGKVLVSGGSGEASFSSLALGSTELFFCSTCLAPPNPPTQVTAEDEPSDEGGTIRISWTPSLHSGIQEYRVYSSAQSGGPYSLVGTLPTSSVSTYQDTELANGVVQHYIVRTFDGNQESENSHEASALALDNLPPSPPTGLSVTDLLQDDGTALSISWVPSPRDDVVEQRVYRGSVSGGPYSLVSTISGSHTTNFVDEPLVADTIYYYAISAFDGTQESPLTPELSGQPRDNRPVAKPLHLEVVEDGAVSITLMGENHNAVTPVSYTIATVPAYGHLSGQPPHLTYTPLPDFNGVDGFSYVVSVGTLESLPANVMVTVLPVNDPPIAIDDVFTIKEDDPETYFNVLANDTTAPDTGEVLTITEVTSITNNGLLTIGPDHQGLYYTPPQNFFGTETLTYTIMDGLITRKATVSVEVTPVNDPPTITSYALSWLPSSSPNVVEQRVYRSQHSGGPYELLAKIEEPLVFSFHDGEGFAVGTPSYYVIRAFDGTQESVDSNEIHEVSGHRFVAVQEETPISMVLPGFDPEGDPLSTVIQQHPQHGTITGDWPNLMYTPHPNFVGMNSLQFAVSDGELLSKTGTVTFEVSGINDPPTAHSQALQVNPNSEVPIILTGEDGDPEIDQVLSFVLDTVPTAGILSLTAGGPEIVQSQLPVILEDPHVFHRSLGDGLETSTFAFHVEDNGGTSNGGIDTSAQANVIISIVP